MVSWSSISGCTLSYRIPCPMKRLDLSHFSGWLKWWQNISLAIKQHIMRNSKVRSIVSTCCSLDMIFSGCGHAALLDLLDL